MRLNFLSSVGWYFDFASIPISFLYTFFITFHRVLMYTIFFASFTRAGLLFSSVLQLLGCFFLVSGWGFQDLLQACFSLFF